MAVVADRVITANEFRERAELTPRQPYCQSNAERDKIIVLNTLIAEKILALESKNDSNLINNQSFQAYIKGRKEQYMREQLFYQEAFYSVKIDTTELEQAYKLAGRQYQLEYYTIDSSQSRKFQRLIDEHPELKTEFFDNVNLTSQPPIKKVSWPDNETPDILHQALFTTPLQINQILGPIQLDYNQYIILKITDWTDSPALGGQAVQHRWQMVKQKLKSLKANKLWTNYTNKVMRHKKIEFNKTSYIKVFKIFEAWLAQNENQVQHESSQLQKMDLEENYLAVNFSDQQLLAAPFCKINDEVWTVQDFKTALLSHPLVFRKIEIKNREELLEQFKLAIADLIKDHFIICEAYKRKLDKSNEVICHTQKWHDALAAVYHRDRYIKQISQQPNFDKNRLKGNHTDFDIYLDSLRSVYDAKIEINLSLFKMLRLTSVPMIVTRPDLPYKIPTPAFPLLTDNDNLDYSRLRK